MSVAFLIGDHEMRAVDTRTGALYCRECNVTATLNFVAWTADGSFILTAGHDAALRVWQYRRRHAFVDLKGHTRQVLAAASAPDDALVGTASADGTLRLWSLRDEGVRRVFATGVRVQLNAVAFARAGDYIVGGSSEGDVLWWSVSEGSVLGRMRYGPGAISCISATLSGAVLAASTALGTAAVVDGTTMEARTVREGAQDDFVSTVCWRPGVPGLDVISVARADDDGMSWTEVMTDTSTANGDVDMLVDVDVDAGL